jgi:D-sedoheptulose 7-phosphate isomerase
MKENLMINKNEGFDLSDQEIILAKSNYFIQVETAFNAIKNEQYVGFIKNLNEKRESKKNVYVAGNGGSYSNADHIVCDIGKNIGQITKNFAGFKSFLLGNGVSTMTAVSNDFGYEKLFSTNLELLGNPGDGLICLSVSGQSPNIIAALKKARELGITSFGIYGFNGGDSSKLTDFSINVDSSNFGVVEDIQMMIFHNIVNLYASKLT